MTKISEFVNSLARTLLKSLGAISCLGAALVLPASAQTYGGLSFNGTSQYVDFGTATNLGSPTYTLETWFNWKGYGATASTGSGGVTAIPLIAKLVGEADGSNLDGNYFLGINPSGNVLATDFEEGSTATAPGLNHGLSGAMAITSNAWHHAAVTYDGTTLRIYLDGNPDSTLTVGQPPRWDSIQHAALASALNSSGTPNGYFAGTLDEVRIWNYARSATQIASNMTKQIVSASGLLGRWSLNETNGTIANDSSGTGANGTLMNSPVWAAGYPGFGAAVAITNPADGAVYLLPTNMVMSASASGFSGTVTNVAFFAGASLLSNVTNSPYTWTWTNPPAAAYALTAVGMDSGGVRATSAVVNITVVTNLPPTVVLTSPTNNAAYAAPANVTVTATATDSLGISKVDFYQGVTKLYTATTSPYSFLWGSVPGGSYQLSAVATDLGGLAATSAVVNITVTNDLPPVVSLTYPANNQTFAAPTNITLTATASDADGTVTNVEFYAGGAKIGQSTSTPYNMVWSVASGGSSQLYAVAIDNAGLRATSAVVNVTFSGNIPPTVAITNPGNNASFGAGGSILISATAADSDGTITNVAFYAGASLLGQIKTSPYNYTWTNVPAGSYVLTAVAFDNSGARATSAPVNITMIQTSASQWVAFFDYTSGSGTGANVLTVAGNTGSGYLINQATGQQLPEFLAMSTVGSPGGANTVEALYSGTPAYNVFNGYCDLSGNCAAYMSSSGQSSSIVISNLNPNARYSVIATVNRDNSAYNLASGRVTLVELLRASSYAPAHTTGIVTNGLAANQAGLIAYNATGEYVCWTNISSGSGGTIELKSSRLSNQTAYAMSALRIEEFAVSGPMVQLTAPGNNARVVLPTNLVVTALTSGFGGVVTNVAFYNWPTKLGDDPIAPFSYAWTNVTPGTYTLRAVAMDNTGVSATSAPVAITVASNLPPSIAITSPSDSTTFTAPTDIPITVSTGDTDGFVTNVQFYANGVKIGQNPNSPFSFDWPSVPTNVYNLTAVAYDDHGTPATSAVVRVYVIMSSAPTVVSFDPPAGSLVSNFTQVTVNFNQPVNGVNASDLLINNVPASSMAGANGTYTFSFARPLEGLVLVTWAVNHGIVNRESTPKPFNGTYTNEMAQYSYRDTIPPVVTAVSPLPGAVLPGFTSLTVTFSEPVRGVQAGSLLINGVAADNVAGAGAGPYTFVFTQPPAGPVTVSWAAGHGIHDVAAVPNAFVAGSPWSYTLDPTLTETSVVINEIYFNPPSGNPAEQWLELYNKGAAAVNLAGWSFSKGLSFTFPAVTIPAGGYLVVAADLPTFSAKHPGVANVVGGWPDGMKSHLILVDAAGNVANDLQYAKGGDWGERLLGSGESAAVSVTRSGTTVTVVRENYMNNGDTAIISGADQPEYNGTFTVANCTMVSFTYTITGTPVSPATSTNNGVIIVRQMTDWGQLGWTWGARADGLGASLELMNPNLSNQYGQNWRDNNTNGTPGRANSVATNNVAPLILNVQHFPMVPRPTNNITITAQIIDEHTTGVAATLWWRLDALSNSLPFSSTSMLDDGLHGDGVAGDGIYGAVLPPQTNNAIVEFYVTATDAEGHIRMWPAAPLDANRVAMAPTNVPNALLQVDNNAANDYTPTNGFPVYRFIMRQADMTNYNAFPSKAPNSDARMCMTWIATDGTSAQAIYLTEVRDRGNGTRSRTPANYRVSFPADQSWHGIGSLELNSQYTESQLAGYALCLQAGTYAEWGRVARVRINNIDRTSSGSPQFGVYIELTPLDATFVKTHFPDDPGGNLYRGQGRGVLGEPLHVCSLTNTSTDWTGFARLGFSQQAGNGDWSDLTGLCLALNTNAVDDATYVAAIRQVIDVDEWMRNIAWFTLTVSRETSLQATGVGDDYTLYRGVNDTRFRLLAHDLDTILNEGDTTGGYTDSIWRMVPFIVGSTNNNPGPNMISLNRFMTHPQFVPSYFRELYRQATNIFAPGPVRQTLSMVLSNFVPQTTINNMVTYSSNRVNYVLSQIPLALTVSNTLSQSNGYYYTTTPTVTCYGTANAMDTRSVAVNGVASTWLAWQARWTNTVTLNPGVNRLVVESRDSNNVAFASTNIDVWYDATGVSVSGALSGTVVWTAASGPYRVTGNVTVGNGVVLTIQPGASVFFSSGVTLTVSGSGQVLANGTAGAHIRFTKVPGGANWGSFDFIGATNESRLAYADFEACGGTTIGGHDAQMHVNGASKVFIDHCNWPASGLPSVQYISFDGSTFIVQNCVFPTYPGPSGSQPELLHGINGINAGGYGILRDDYFGHTWGFNDTIDFTGGQRQGSGVGPILQVINCIFDGASDDCLDLDSTDAWIEGNIFMHVHRDPARTDNALDTSSAISGGVDFASQYSDWTLVNNIFFDVDHVFLNKSQSSGGGRVAMFNNTVIHVNKEYSGSTLAEIGAFDWSDDATTSAPASVGSGLYAANNIIYDCPVLNVTNSYLPNLSNYTIILDNNILSVPWTGLGRGNQVVDPRLNLSVLGGTAWTNATVAQARAAAQLLADSPAIGAGFGGRDLGALVPFGIAIAGEPRGTTGSNNATLTVGLGGTFNWGTWPPQAWGYTAFKWKLDNGAWSAEIPVANNSPFTNLPAITLSNLSDGPHTVYVDGKNDAPPGYYQDDTFLYPATAGVPAHLSASRTWFVLTNTTLLRLNEVLAWNNTAVPVNGLYPDLVELYNAGTTAVNLSGMSLSDDPAAPQKYVFPNGASLGAGQYLVVYADSAVTPPGYHLGFGLNKDGEAVYLYTAGGALVDAVTFGPQLADYSIGRLANGQWGLCVPTFGAANVAAPTGDAHKLKINEWLTSAFDLYASDFLELYNGDTLPVSLGGLYLSDAPLSWPDKDQLAALSFIAAQGFVVFQPDGSPDLGATHLNFKLSPDRGEIGLSDSSLNLIDYVLYGPQQTDVSQGRSPNGGTNIAFLAVATPGSPNPGPTPLAGTQVVINEVLARNTAGLTNVDGGTPAWIELYNPTTNLWNLSDMSLATNAGAPRAFVFPAGTTIASGGFLVVLFDPSQPPSSNAVAQPNTGFGLPANGGTVYLYDKLANGGSELNSISYGVQANDYSIGRLPNNGGTNWGLTLPTPKSGNLAAGLGDPMQLHINEWMASNPNGADWFELYNPTPQPVALGGLYLTDDLSTPASRQKFPIAPLSFIGNGLYGYVRFWADKTPAAGPDHVNFKLKAGGAALGLYAPGDARIDSLTYGAQSSGVSQGRLPDGAANIVLFQTTASPADANYLPLTNVVVNEVLTAIPSNAPLEQAIELLNAGSVPLNVSGWWLSNQKHHLQKYQFDSGTVIPAGGYLVVYANDLTSSVDPTLRVSLDAVNGDQIYLSAADTNGVLTGYRTVQDFGAAAPGVSFGRYTNSVGNVDFTAMSRTTFGADSADRVEDFRLGAGANNAYPVVGPIVLTEIMYRPIDFPGGVNNVRDEFMEWRNISSNTVRLYDPANPQNTWHVRGGLSYDFPTNVSLASGAFLLVVSFDPVNDTNSRAGFLAAYPQLASNAVLYGPYSGALGNNGDTIDLNKPGTPVAGIVPRILVEHVAYSQNMPWDIGANGTGNSLQRLYLALYGNDPANWEAATPTPGSVYNANPDTDGDGIPDAWMENYFGHSEGQTADNSMWYQDADGDGMNNLQEYQAGTNPRDPNSTLKLTMQLTTTNLIFSFDGVMTKSYVIKTSGALSGSWSNVVVFDPLPASGPVSFSTAVPSPATRQQFYRVVTPATP